jgi:dipeptidyl aminopeptidase/acylaminoacyl peptidase
LLKLRLPCVFMLLFGLVVAALPANARAFSMEDVLSAPFVGNLTSSPDGTVLVWKVHLRGQRNLYTNEGGTVRRITSYDQDDGQDIDNVAILPDNDAVVYMRGGTEDNAGADNINPRSSVPPPVRGVYLLSLHGGTPQQLGEGSQVTLSPRGNAVAWVKDGVLTISTLTKSATGYAGSKPETLSIRGQAQSLAWSPDGTHIAFTDGRDGNHSYIVIYSPGEHHYVYATPDFAIDDFAAWSPDSRSVAFARTPGAREDESPYLDPPHAPWSIWVADAATGHAHRAWQARRGMGETMYQSTSNAQLYWLGGDHIAFAWEGTGWQNLYAVPASGGNATPLATGPFEAETIVPALDGRSLLYATNEGDIDRRHIWQVGLNAKPHPLTSGTLDQWSPTPLAHGDFAYVNSGYNVVTTVTIGSTKATVVGEATPANFPAGNLVAPQLVTFRAHDGLVIHGQLFVPRGGGKHPAMIFDHGGPVRQMLPGFHYMEAYTNLYESNQYLANHGFVVLSINYRSGIMYGHNFRQAKHVGALGASEYQDVLAGARFLQARSDVDGKRLGIYGLSYGGYLTAMGLARNSDIFKAGSDYAGVHNWATLVDWYAGGKVVGTLAQRKLAYDSSPIATLDRWHSPVFISQGDDDRNVAFSQGVDLTTRLRDRNVHVETMVLPNETHENQVWADMVRQYQASAEFLSRMLRP